MKRGTVLEDEWGSSRVAAERMGMEGREKMEQLRPAPIWPVRARPCRHRGKDRRKHRRRQERRRGSRGRRAGQSWPEPAGAMERERG